MKIGDKVRFLSEVGGGVVTGFQGRELAEICRAVWLENYQRLQPQGHVYGYDPADGYELFL